MSPRPRLILLFASIVPLLAAGVWIAEIEGIALIANLVLVGVALGDLFLSQRPSSVRLRREVAEILSVGAKNTVEITASHHGTRFLRVEISDEPPEPSRTTKLPIVLELPPERERTATYSLEPQRRGAAEFGCLHLRFSSRLGLWLLAERRPAPLAVRVYPNIQAVERFDLLAMRDRLAATGLRFWRTRGAEGEFDRLREYRREDESRHIDWKATAKHGNLISREFTIERDQHVVILVDCGRTMAQESEGVSHIDRAINATVILSHIALRQGDNVSVIAFSNRMERCIGPVRGRSAIHGIVRALHDLQPREETSDYGLVWEELDRRQRKRALVLLITHALDEQHLRTIAAHIRPLRRTHLLLCSFLRDVALHDFAAQVPESDLQAFEVAAAGELLVAQADGLAKLEKAGASVVEVPPNELSTIVINRYLEIKARHQL